LLALYDEAVVHADSVLGELLDSIGARSRNNTAGAVVVVTADHGEEFFEHGHFGHGKTLYDEVARVPLVIAAPGLPAGTTRDDPVMLIDVASTVAALAGVSPESKWQGTNLFDRGADVTRDAYAELLREGGLESHMLSNGRLKLIESNEGLGTPLRSELYDLASDPGERRPLAVLPADAAEGGRDLAAALASMREQARASALTRDTTAGNETNPERLRALGYLN
jgi:arylsulfatase A-like enzyme